ncbi:GTPase domain-containing protein [Rhodococcus erythropolis]|uniref:GTPase domain-containing protein n=1 Tax=Rhodococcus erythropolis TaxID=1833 RepID=UPI003A4D79C2
MNDIDVLKVKEWLASLPGGSLAENYAEQWQQFASIDAPVITIFGSYDTGKSSLLRRLLVDSEVRVPDWLTISARHETFDVNSVELAGVVLRDTPGLAIGAKDARGVMNTQRATEAIDLTDIAIITVTTQLATGEHQALREIVGSGWTSDSLWFSISRFDEAGIDPDDDLAGYRQLASRKTVELSESLELSAAYPIFVVAQDFAQMAGSTRDVDAEVWDDSRQWDGMDALSAAIERVAASDFAALRASTERRYWRQTVVRIVAELRTQLDACAPLAAQADATASRRRQSLVALESADSAAKDDLRGALGEATRKVVESGVLDQSEVVAALRPTLVDWFGKHQRELDRLRQDVGKSAERQRNQPSWGKLEGLVAKIADNKEPAAAIQLTAFAPHVSMVGALLIRRLRDFERVQKGASFGKGTNRGSAGRRSEPNAWSLSDGADIAAFLLPIVVQIAAWIDDVRMNRAVASQEQKSRDEQRSKLTAAVSAIALDSWSEAISEVRNEIDDAGAHAELSEGLRDSIAKLESAISEGEGLL